MTWEAQSISVYPVDIEITAYDREGLIRDITTTIANEKIKLLALNSNISSLDNAANIHVTIEINDLALFETLLKKLVKIPTVTNATRRKA